MHSHVPINAKTNTVRLEGRINALQSYTLQDLAFCLMIVTQTFLKWVKNQPDIYILDEDEEGNTFQFVLSEEMHRFFAPLPEANNKRITLSKETKTEK
jgi:hypothetical protein